MSVSFEVIYPPFSWANDELTSVCMLSCSVLHKNPLLKWSIKKTKLNFWTLLIIKMRVKLCCYHNNSDKMKKFLESMHFEHLIYSPLKVCTQQFKDKPPKTSPNRVLYVGYERPSVFIVANFRQLHVIYTHKLRRMRHWEKISFWLCKVMVVWSLLKPFSKVKHYITRSENVVIWLETLETRNVKDNSASEEQGGYASVLIQFSPKIV